MKIAAVITALVTLVFSLSFRTGSDASYQSLYLQTVEDLWLQQSSLLQQLHQPTPPADSLVSTIHRARLQMKAADFWLRYFEPNLYRKINGPLPVEWENEVFEKFEAPYRRTGAGLSLLEKKLSGDEPGPLSFDSLVIQSLEALKAYQADSITGQLKTMDHFFLANRLFLLNLAAIYTTGFECPDTNQVIPELRSLMDGVKKIYTAYNRSFPAQPLPDDFLALYNQAIRFCQAQPANFSAFDRYSFIRDFVNPLFGINQRMIRTYRVMTRNYNDYTLNNDCSSIFDKTLYSPQNAKGIFSLVEDSSLLADIRSAGRLLFFDPLLSGNNERSCASCHKPEQFFTDTTVRTAFAFGQDSRLSRNTPSLLNVGFQHLIMLDGKHISLQDQARAVMHNPAEMNEAEATIVKKVMSCKTYRDVFRRAVRYTPEEKEVTLSHIISAITYYYSDLDYFSAPFDEGINGKKVLPDEIRMGFNLFMSKAQCGTCHFMPIFNGVKPPYIGSEFEVIGTPAENDFRRLSQDSGRFLINPGPETLHAFRTSTLRNAGHTAPYMHNGVFRTLEEVIDFYDAGGGVGKGLIIPNQTLAADSLHLAPEEKKALLAFILSLNENCTFDPAPQNLPASSIRTLNTRKPGGMY